MVLRDPQQDQAHLNGKTDSKPNPSLTYKPSFPFKDWEQGVPHIIGPLNPDFMASTVFPKGLIHLL